MVWNPVSLAALLLVAHVGAAHAQSANDFSGPRETPPSSFTGQQFVDSRGCVFLRAGLAGRTNWVPRVTQDRKQLCGYPPTFSEQKIEVAKPAPKAVPAPKVTSAGRAPIETVATTTAPPKIRETPPKSAARLPAESYAAAKPVKAAPAPQPAPVSPATARATAQTTANTAGKAAAEASAAGPETLPAAPAATRKTKARPANGCYADVPLREVFEIRGGGTITLCTAGNGSLRNARPPRLAARLAGGAAEAPASAHMRADAGQAPRVSLSSQDGQPPKGYKMAWKDDRLNPNRGKGTAAGWAEQDQVWTRETPAQLVEDATRSGKKVVVLRRVTVSSKSSPVEAAGNVAGKVSGRTAAKEAAGGKTYIQVGTFGLPANADAAAGRLKGMGLPVARAKTAKSGKALQIVMAGPFLSDKEARAALAAARRAGFKDAFIR